MLMDKWEEAYRNLTEIQQTIIANKQSIDIGIHNRIMDYINTADHNMRLIKRTIKEQGISL